MNFIQLIHAEAIHDFRKEYESLVSLASSLVADKTALHKLSSSVVKLVGKSHAFLLDPIVQWTIAANRIAGEADFFWNLGEAVKKRQRRITPHGSLERKRLELIIDTQRRQLIEEKPLLRPRELRRLCQDKQLWKGDQSKNASFRKWLQRNQKYIKDALNAPVDYFEAGSPGGNSRLVSMSQKKVGSPSLSPEREQEFLRASLQVSLDQIGPFLSALRSHTLAKK